MRSEILKIRFLYFVSRCFFWLLSLLTRATVFFLPAEIRRGGGIDGVHKYLHVSILLPLPPPSSLSIDVQRFSLLPFPLLLNSRSPRRCALCRKNLEWPAVSWAGTDTAASQNNRNKCRNCWRDVCDDCVGTFWPSSMVPPRSDISALGWCVASGDENMGGAAGWTHLGIDCQVVRRHHTVIAAAAAAAAFRTSADSSPCSCSVLVVHASFTFHHEKAECTGVVFILLYGT